MMEIDKQESEQRNASNNIPEKQVAEQIEMNSRDHIRELMKSCGIDESLKQLIAEIGRLIEDRCKESILKVDSGWYDEIYANIETALLFECLDDGNYTELLISAFESKSLEYITKKISDVNYPDSGKTMESVHKSILDIVSRFFPIDAGGKPESTGKETTEKEKQPDIEENKNDESVELHEVNEQPNANENSEELCNLRDQFKEFESKLNEVKKDYEEWYEYTKKITKSVRLLTESFNIIVEGFNNGCEELNQGVASGEDKSFIISASKGIFIFLKMLKNVVENRLDKLEKIKKFENPPLVSWNNIKGQDSQAISDAINENFNILASYKKERDLLISTYFKFVNDNILNIADGIESGSKFPNSKYKVASKIKQLVDDTYGKLHSELMCMLSEAGIKEMDCKEGERIDFEFHQPFDVEETKDRGLHETIMEVSSPGYVFSRDLYGVGHNHVVRQAQVVVYRYSEAK